MEGKIDMINEDKIKFKSKKWPLFLGIALFILLAPFPVLMIYMLFQPDIELVGKIIAIIVGSMFLFIPYYGAFAAIQSYFTNGKRLKKSLSQYGEQNLIANIHNNTISAYKNPLAVNGNKVYFTDKFVIDPGETIIDYNEISLMYKHVSRSRYGSMSCICFELLDGSSWQLCKVIKDEQIANYMQLCFQHNQKILFGYTNENKAQHKERVKQYKSGNINIPQITL